MDPITLDLVFTVFASSALIGSSAIALCLLPRTGAEAAALTRAFTRAGGAVARACARALKA